MTGYEYPVHRRLLQAGTTIIEGLDLSAVDPDQYQLWCLPLLLVRSEAALARAVIERRSCGQIAHDIGGL